MKLSTLKNLFEFKDNVFEGVYENIISQVGNLQGLGLPDICIISRKQIKNFGMFKSNQELTSSFHFVTGLCPTSQAEVSAYIQQLINSQERETNSKLLAGDVIITKISYLIYDIFSKTMLVCVFEQPTDSLSQFKTFGVQSNKNVIQLSKGHWEGGYVSCSLRTLDSESRIPSIGKVFNQVQISNPIKLAEFIKKLFSQMHNIDNQFQQSQKLRSKNDFPTIDDALYYINWPLYIVIKQLEKSAQLEVLLKSIEHLECNTLTHLLKGIIHYKLKNYTKCLLEMQIIDNLYLAKYIQAKAAIKNKQFQQAYLILQELIRRSYDNQILWITLAQLFRKQKQYQLSLIFLNRACSLPNKTNIKVVLQEVNLHNYRILAQSKNLSTPQQMDQLFKIVHPQVADRIESYVQLSGFPNLESLLVRPRQAKKEQKFYDQLVKLFARPEYKVGQSNYDILMNGSLTESELESNQLHQEIIKLISCIGLSRLKTLVQSVFYQPVKVQKHIDQLYDPGDFSISLLSKKSTLTLNVSQISCTNKSMNNPRFQEDIDDMDSDDEKPSFLKQKLNKSFDFSQAKHFQTPQHKSGNKSPPPRTKFKKPIQQNSSLKKAHTIIMENAQESIESERQIVQMQQMMTHVHDSQINQGPKSGVEHTAQKTHVVPLVLYFDKYLPQGVQIQMNDQLMRRKETLCHTFSEIVENIARMMSELDNQFYPTHPQQQQHNVSGSNSSVVSPAAQSPLFKANLKKALQNKQHLEKPVELKDFYIMPNFVEEESKEQSYYAQVKSEAIYLFKCSKLALALNKRDLALQILMRMNQKIISVQISELLFKAIDNNPKLVIRHIQRILGDFQECGINQVSFVPIWIEQQIIKLTKQTGANQVLGLLSNSDTDFTFYLIKKVILQVENLI